MREFEAETVAHLACQRLDASVRMPVYLHQYLQHEAEVRAGISLERIMWAAGQVIGMAEGTARPRIG